MTQTISQDISVTIALIGLAVLEAVNAAGELGAPSGTLYAGLMSQGATLNQYQSLMDGLVNKGKLRREGHLYFLTESGRGLMTTLAKKFPKR